MAEAWIITLGVLICIIGFAGWTFVFALKLVLNMEDAVTIDPVPPHTDNFSS
ncbi:hypothetical protein [Bacillus sp. FJAT-49736]|uniref:hypothetical protein n=1 Tax=Bacillus sp. FJAT-49736 TaxID=2833582 RepID=UPI001BCA39A3|nr:hypothetical protein [Bacillus sp. FJAT-49736]MBS4175001.1 hypothetical protein [Bacillus sp. FJAT-49736]